MCQDVVTTEWVAGGVAEVGWGIIANHGGGYQYRLCRWGGSYLISSLIYDVIYDNQLCCAGSPRQEWLISPRSASSKCRSGAQIMI